MEKLGNILFKYRSYTPLPFVFLMILFMNPTPMTMITGFLILLIGESIRIWSVSYAGSETRTTSGVGGSNLVTQGPYAIIRNPLYWGNIMMYAGIGVMSNALFPILTIVSVLYFTFQYYLIIFNEEGYLRITYKDNFETYCSHVHRFFPFPKTLPSGIKSNLLFDLKDGLKSEKRSIQAAIIISIIILLKFIFF
ncbi:MAG: isoprenylcysteine carboxylmethyltransferase family protein [Ignavibacteriae bacterium]|nr:isoprenylcysteine carboxylmethyltransferase family protein [Ignavibacteriota bacterium]